MYGLVLKSTDFNILSYTPSYYLIGGTNQIKIGETATLLSDGRCIEVELLGYYLHPKYDQQQLIIKIKDKGLSVGPGSSGSPIIQNDVLIGFLVGPVGVEPTSVLKAALASEVYVQTYQENSIEP